MNRRATILRGLKFRGAVGVEIAPLDKPLVTRDMGEVLYVDHADTATLKRKYRRDAAIRHDAIVDIDGVWGENTLSEAIGGPKVDYIVASHVIGHVPDLVTWLIELDSVLAPAGQVRLAILDMRFTFGRYPNVRV